jgi:hypothetical protein
MEYNAANLLMEQIIGFQERYGDVPRALISLSDTVMESLCYESEPTMPMIA